MFEAVGVCPVAYLPLPGDHRGARHARPTIRLPLLGPKGGHPRRSNYANDSLTLGAEGLYPGRKGVRRPVYVTAGLSPGLPIRKGNRRHKAAPGKGVYRKHVGLV